MQLTFHGSSPRLDATPRDLETEADGRQSAAVSGSASQKTSKTKKQPTNARRLGIDRQLWAPLQNDTFAIERADRCDLRFGYRVERYLFSVFIPVAGFAGLCGILEGRMVIFRWGREP